MCRRLHCTLSLITATWFLPCPPFFPPYSNDHAALIFPIRNFQPAAVASICPILPVVLDQLRTAAWARSQRAAWQRLSYSCRGCGTAKSQTTAVPVCATADREVHRILLRTCGADRWGAVLDDLLIISDVTSRDVISFVSTHAPMHLCSRTAKHLISM